MAKRIRMPPVRVPARWGDEAMVGFGESVLPDFAKGKIDEWSTEWQPLVRLLRSKKPLPSFLPLDLLPPYLREIAERSVNRKPAPWEKDLAITNFIEDGMPPNRKRKGVPKNLVNDAKKKFGLKSKSAILRAITRGKRWKKLRSQP
jgi:hypothetical protein